MPVPTPTPLPPGETAVLQQLTIARPSATGGDPNLMLRALTPSPGLPAGTGRNAIGFVDDRGKFQGSIEIGGADQAFKIYTQTGSYITQRLSIGYGTPEVDAAFRANYQTGERTNVILNNNKLFFSDKTEASNIQWKNGNIVLETRGNLVLKTKNGTTTV